MEEFLQNEDFKYVRALGAFYLRLTGRPAEIYELIEPLYNDFRKLRFRESTGWKITYMDEVADELLNSDRYCGIALPHLPKRAVLESAGYLDGPRRSALVPLIDEEAGGDAEKLLQKMADNGNSAAKVAIDERMKRKAEAKEKEARIVLERQREASAERRERYDRFGGRGSNGSDYYRDSEREYENRDENRESRRRYHDLPHQYHNDRRKRRDDYSSGRESGYDNDRHDRRRRDEYVDERNHGKRYDDRGYRDEHGGSNSKRRQDNHYSEHDHEQSETKSRHHKERKSSKEDKKYGSLFKKSSRLEGAKNKSLKKVSGGKDGGDNDANVIDGSEEFWNDQRAKLGLKPLKN